jgi:hypothetical protein
MSATSQAARGEHDPFSGVASARELERLEGGAHDPTRIQLAAFEGDLRGAGGDVVVLTGGAPTTGDYTFGHMYYLGSPPRYEDLCDRYGSWAVHAALDYLPPAAPGEDRYAQVARFLGPLPCPSNTTAERYVFVLPPVGGFVAQELDFRPNRELVWLRVLSQEDGPQWRLTH